jgi:hypothetical protein
MTNSRPLGGTVQFSLAATGVAFALLSAHCGQNDGRVVSPEAGPLSDATVGSDGAMASDGGASDASSADAGPVWVTPQLGTIVDAGSPGTVDLTFAVHADQGAHAISPYIYGVNNGNQAAAHHATIVRSGGNRLTAYNWENNASNAGSDYQFENDDFLCGTMGGKTNAYPCAPDSGAPGAYVKAVTDQARAAGAAVLITVPIVDYVSADKSPGGDVRLAADGGAIPNYLQTRFKKNVAAKGAPFQNPPDPTDDSVYEDEMVNWFAQTEPNEPVRFLLDNEPDLWSSTHAEVHPVPVTYAELVQRNVSYATAVKAVMPSAEVWGPVSFGWSGYVNLQNASDAAGRNFISFWLGSMVAVAEDAGTPVVDGMDLHWYPEAGDITPSATLPAGADCRITNDPANDTQMATDCYTDAGLAGQVAAREQAPRSLWDPSYVETSWITGGPNGKAIQLIPSMLSKIAQADPTKKFPTMKLGFSEWNYGGGGDISGTIATADVLGIFGSYGVDMSMLWEVWPDESFTYAAYDAYRDFDGHGGQFGDTSIAATTTDVPDSSIYASIDDAAPSTLVIVAINKALTSKVAGIQIYHSTVYSTAAVYTVTSAGATVAPGAAIDAVATNAFAYTMPAQSVSVLVPVP